MKKIILCVLLFASFIFALNCQLLTEEQKETMAREHFTEIPAIINSGIMCEDGLYYNATSVLFVDLCKAFNNKTKTETTIVNVLDNKRIKIEYTYDEFGIAIEESNDTIANMMLFLFLIYLKKPLPFYGNWLSIF